MPYNDRGDDTSVAVGWRSPITDTILSFDTENLLPEARYLSQAGFKGQAKSMRTVSLEEPVLATIEYLNTRMKPRPDVMYSSLRAVNCSAPAVSRTSSYVREVIISTEIKRYYNAKINATKAETLQAAESVNGSIDTNEKNTHPCWLPIDFHGPPVFLCLEARGEENTCRGIESTHLG